jgi:rod shape-determining protein MreD
MSIPRDRGRLWVVISFLVILHFALRPRLGSPQIAPDFLLLALMLYAIRSRPGSAALAGFIVGLVGDAMVPARLGAGALAHTVVGYLAAWGRAVFFPDNLFVNGVAIAAGAWARNAIQLLASGGGTGGLMVQLFVYAPLQALLTAVTGAVALVVFQRWLDIRLET